MVPALTVWNWSCVEQGMRCYFIDQIYMKNIWVKLNSETSDSRTDDFFKNEAVSWNRGTSSF